MTKLTWDKAGERRYETGVDRAVLFLPDGTGVPWNGLISVDEESSATLEEFTFDGVKYLTTRTSGNHSGTISAYTYPEEFEQFDGLAETENRMTLTNQPVTQTFDLCYRTRVGNDIDGTDHGYKIHIIYNLMATPDTRSFETMSDQVDAIDLGWTFSATPEVVPGYRPTAHVIFDSTKLNSFLMKDVENLLYGEDAEPIDITNDRLDGGTPTPTDDTLGGQLALVDGGTPFATSFGSIDGGTPTSSSTTDDQYVPTTPDARLPRLAELMEKVTAWRLISIVDNGDGTWTATGPDALVRMLDATTFEIREAEATYLDSSTYEISTTHGF